MTVEFADLLASTWERGLAFFTVRYAGRPYGVCWAVPHDGWVAVAGFEYDHERHGFWRRPEAMAEALTLTLVWAGEAFAGTRAFVMIPCRDERFTTWATEYGLPTAGTFRERLYVARLGT